MRDTKYEIREWPNKREIKYVDDPVDQLFDMKNDPGETRNLVPDSRHAPTLAEHRRLLGQHEAILDVPNDIPHAGFWRKRG